MTLGRWDVFQEQKQFPEDVPLVFPFLQASFFADSFRTTIHSLRCPRNNLWSFSCLYLSGHPGSTQDLLNFQRWSVSIRRVFVFFFNLLKCPGLSEVHEVNCYFRLWIAICQLIVKYHKLIVKYHKGLCLSWIFYSTAPVFNNSICAQSI